MLLVLLKNCRMGKRGVGAIYIDGGWGCVYKNDSMANAKIRNGNIIT